MISAKLFCTFLFSIYCSIDGENVYQDPCLTNPCGNQATCVRIGLESHYLCICPKDNWGQRCEFQAGVLPCLNHKCANGAMCIPDAKFNTKYRCLCPSGFVGQFCNETKATTPLQRCQSVCGEWGTGQMDKRKKCTCTCKEPSMYVGQFCNESLPCAAFPCKNGGVCKVKAGKNDYKCYCSKYYKGTNCAERNWCSDPPDDDSTCPFKDPCKEIVCQNGGSCKLIHNNTKKKWDPVSKCMCQYGFKGVHCEIKITPCDLTAAEEDCNDAFLNNKTEMWEMCGNMTKKIQKCYNNGTCVFNTKNSVNVTVHSCNCASGWMGNTCELNDPCANETACINSTCIVAPLEQGVAIHKMCICKAGYSDSDCHVLDPNVCAPDKVQVQCYFGGICISCHHNSSSISPFCRTANDFKRGYVCACPLRRTGPLCDESTFPCDIRRCKNGGVCKDMNETDYECTCLDGYIGRNCEFVDDYCVARTPCLNGGSCFVTEDEQKFQCECAAEFHGSFCQIEYYNFAGFNISFYTHLTVWSFIAGSIASLLFAFSYWLFLAW